MMYKGYEIRPAPLQLADSGEWQVHLTIAVERGGERIERPFSAGNTYKSKEKAVQHCTIFGMQIIDGHAEGCTVADL